jgi:hypothetical protein
MKSVWKWTVVWQSGQRAPLAVLWGERCHSSVMRSPVTGEMLAVLLEWQPMHCCEAVRVVVCAVSLPQPADNANGRKSRTNGIE